MGVFSTLVLRPQALSSPTKIRVDIARMKSEVNLGLKGNKGIQLRERRQHEGCQRDQPGRSAIGRGVRGILLMIRLSGSCGP